MGRPEKTTTQLEFVAPWLGTIPIRWNQVGVEHLWGHFGPTVKLFGIEPEFIVSLEKKDDKSAAGIFLDTASFRHFAPLLEASQVRTGGEVQDNAAFGNSLLAQGLCYFQYLLPLHICLL